MSLDAIRHLPCAYRPVNRLLLDSVPLACEVERFDPQVPPWEAVAVRVLMLRPLKTASLFCSLAFLWPYWTTAINSPLKLSKHGADRPTVGPQRQKFMQERLLSLGESAAHQGVNADTICKWIERKDLPPLAAYGGFWCPRLTNGSKAGKAGNKSSSDFK